MALQTKVIFASILLNVSLQKSDNVGFNPVRAIQAFLLGIHAVAEGGGGSEGVMCSFSGGYMCTTLKFIEGTIGSILGEDYSLGVL